MLVVETLIFLKFVVSLILTKLLESFIKEDDAVNVILEHQTELLYKNNSLSPITSPGVHVLNCKDSRNDSELALSQPVPKFLNCSIPSFVRI